MIRNSLVFCAFVFVFEVMPHPSCYFTSIMGKTHHGLVISFFFWETAAPFLVYIGGVLETNLFLQFVIDRYILGIQQIITQGEHLQYSFSIS